MKTIRARLEALERRRPQSREAKLQNICERASLLATATGAAFTEAFFFAVEQLRTPLTVADLDWLQESQV